MPYTIWYGLSFSTKKAPAVLRIPVINMFIRDDLFLILYEFANITIMYTLHNMFLKKKFTTIIIVKSGLDAKTLIDGNEIFGQHKGSFTQPLVPIKILHSNQPN